jgi:hypothetical protein
MPYLPLRQLKEQTIPFFEIHQEKNAKFHLNASNVKQPGVLFGCASSCHCHWDVNSGELQ